MNRPLAGTVLAVSIVAASLFAIGGSDASTASADQPSTPVPQTPILSARRFPGALQESNSDPEITASIDGYLSKVTGTTCALVEQDGRVIYSHNIDQVLAPASVMKLATAITALEVLGRDRTLSTRFASAKPPKSGIVDGDLYVIGGGDPILTTNGYKTVFDDPDQFVENMNAVADAVVSSGIKTIRGGIVGDDSRHESTRWVPSWPSRYQIGGTVSPLSALVVNDGSTGYADSPDQPTNNRKAGDPPLLFAQTLKTMLIGRGVSVDGPASAGRAPSDLHDITTHESAPISQIVQEMLVNSDNTTAELLVREIGHEASGSGTTAAGTTAVQQTLAGLGFDLDGFVMIDGSGLDTGNRMPCALALDLVRRIDQDPEIGPRLPVGGRSGTLKKRMLASASTGRVRAKTGTLNSVNALAGFADTPQGNHLSFSFIHNGSDTRTTGVADGFTDRLMSYAKGPKIASLEPLPAR